MTQNIYANLIPERGKVYNKINQIDIICCPDQTDNGSYRWNQVHGSLTEEFQPKILSLKISFTSSKKGMSQEEIDKNWITVGELIDDKPEEVVDLSSIKGLTQTR